MKGQGVYELGLLLLQQSWSLPMKITKDMTEVNATAFSKWKGSTLRVIDM